MATFKRIADGKDHFFVKTQAFTQSAKKELDMMRKLCGKAHAPFLECWTMEGLNCVMIMHDHGTSLDKLTDLSQHEIFQVFLQVFEGLQMLHENSIVHNNVQAKHIVCDVNRTVTLVDFANAFASDDWLNHVEDTYAAAFLCAKTICPHIHEAMDTKDFDKALTEAGCDCCWKKLLLECLESDVTKRMTAKQIVAKWTLLKYKSSWCS